MELVLLVLRVMVRHVEVLRSALSGRCRFFREGSLVSMKNTVLLLQITYAFALLPSLQAASGA